LGFWGFDDILAPPDELELDAVLLVGPGQEGGRDLELREGPVNILARCWRERWAKAVRVWGLQR
jgi:hypothetical protein